MKIILEGRMEQYYQLTTRKNFYNRNYKSMNTKGWKKVPRKMYKSLKYFFNIAKNKWRQYSAVIQFCHKNYSTETWSLFIVLYKL